MCQMNILFNCQVVVHSKFLDRYNSLIVLVNFSSITLLIYLYLSKSWSISFLVTMFLLSHIIHLFSIFSLIFNFFFLIFQLFVILFLTFLLSFTFSSPTTNYLNITFPLSLYFPLFLFFLFSSSYYKFTILFSILLMVFSHTKCSFSLFLSRFPQTKSYFSLSYFFFPIFDGIFYIFLVSLLYVD